MRHYATLWNSAADVGTGAGFYQTAGCLMIESLLTRSTKEPSRVTVLALDERADRLTRAWARSRGWEDAVTVQPLAWLLERRPALAPLQAHRPVNYWCFTLSAPPCSVLLDVVEDQETVAYVDSDCYWWSDPAPMWESFWPTSIGIVPHRFPPHRRDYARSSGQYNVSVVAFRADADGRACAREWEAAVIAKCDADTCGDQKHLDGWPDAYPGKVRVFGNLGVGVAPWHYDAHDIQSGDPPTIDGIPITFSHFHESRRTQDGFKRTGYPLRTQDIEALYVPWEREYLRVEAELRELGRAS